MIRLEEVAVAPGGTTLLDDVNWHLRPSDRTGLVGRNGSGKTTLLRVLAGELTPERGAVQRRGGARIGYLPQHAVSGSVSTVWEEAGSQMARLNALHAAVDRAREAVEAGKPGGVERLDEAEALFGVGGGYRKDETLGEVLHGLGFGPDTWHRNCETFSGGWQMRIALARLLLSEPDVALLDEPTNHLDLESRTWLAGFLAAAPFAVVLVSHDRWLLDQATTHIVETRAREAHLYTGNYSRFLVERDARQSAHATAFDRQQGEIAKLERFVERFGAKATKASQARSRQRQLDKLDRLNPVRRNQAGPRIVLPEAPASAQVVLTLSKAELGWPGQPPVLTELDLVLERGMRIAIVGPNGSGKSTLLRAMAGRHPLSKGRRRVADHVRVGVFTQDLASELPTDQTGAEYLSISAPQLAPERIRSILGALGLSGGAALRPIGQLSGGERARVALAALVIRPHNVLLLDEPTNHLDVETVDVLSAALASFGGALVLVSHDRHLVQTLATHVAVVGGNGSLVLEDEVRAAHFERAASAAQSAAPRAGAEDHAARKRQRRAEDRARRRITDIESEIAVSEKEVADLDNRLVEVATDYARAAELAVEHDALMARIEALFAEWEQLEGSL